MLIGLRWKDIQAFIQDTYIQRIEKYVERMISTARLLREATFMLVTIPEASPVDQTFLVRHIIERARGHVRACIVNNMHGEVHEADMLARLNAHSMPLVCVKHIGHMQSLAGRDRRVVLCGIGEHILQESAILE